MANIRCYLRYSPRPNGQDCTSDIGQLENIERWAAANGHAIVGVYRDKEVSGSTKDRIGLADALSHLEPGEYLVVSSFDRLARSVELQCLFYREVQRKKAQLWSVANGVYNDDDPAVRLIHNVMAAFYEYEKTAIAMRTRSAMRRHMRNGISMGGKAPSGFRIVDKRLVVDHTEQEALDKLFALKADGLSVAKITEELNKKRRFRGKRWSGITVQRILKRGRYPANCPDPREVAT